jgi:hypothetical protein
MFLLRAISGRVSLETNVSTASGANEVVGVESGEEIDDIRKEQYEADKENSSNNNNVDSSKDSTSLVPSFDDEDCSTIPASNLTHSQQHHRQEQQQQQQPLQSPTRLQQQLQEEEEEEGQYNSRFQRNNNNNNVGVLIVYGMEQWVSVPALLLLCPFAGLMTILIVLSEEDWNWKTCLISRNVRRIVYGFQCATFSSLIFLALEVCGCIFPLMFILCFFRFVFSIRLTSH